MDPYSGSHEPFVGEGNHTGKHWTITPIRPILSEEFIERIERKDRVFVLGTVICGS